MYIHIFIHISFIFFSMAYESFKVENIKEMVYGLLAVLAGLRGSEGQSGKHPHLQKHLAMVVERTLSPAMTNQCTTSKMVMVFVNSDAVSHSSMFFFCFFFIFYSSEEHSKVDNQNKWYNRDSYRKYKKCMTS